MVFATPLPLLPANTLAGRLFGEAVEESFKLLTARNDSGQLEWSVPMPHHSILKMNMQEYLLHHPVKVRPACRVQSLAMS